MYIGDLCDTLLLCFGGFRGKYIRLVGWEQYALFLLQTSD
jgi:hypothetical protein